MAKTTHAGNGHREFETLHELVKRFGAADDNATTIRGALAYADESYVFGNGQFRSVPWHAGRISHDCRLAMAAFNAANTANAETDDEIGRSTKSAETKFAVAHALGVPFPTLLEEATDNWLYNYSKMPKADKDAAGYTVELTAQGADGKFHPCTSFDDRSGFVRRILEKDLLAVIPDGMPNAGETWYSVVRASITDYISMLRLDENGQPKRKNPPKTKGAVVASGNGRVSADTLI